MTQTWPWLALIGLGAFHGANPAMGWLFAVALGLHRRGEATIALALVPIALGHAVAIALAVGLFVLAGHLFDARALEVAGGLLLIGWALTLAWRGPNCHVPVGLTTGMLGLFLWSFVMAMGHGAGFMLVPALTPLCLTDPAAPTAALSAPVAAGLTAVALHTAAALVVTGAIAVAVYRWIGVAVLRTAWINLDWLWIAALLAVGALLLL
jgi:hypothetical protein